MLDIMFPKNNRYACYVPGAMERKKDEAKSRTA